MNYFFVSYGLFFLYCAIESIFVRNTRTLGFLYDLFTCLIIVFLIINVVETREQLKKAFYGMIIGAVIFSIIIFSYYDFSFAKLAQDAASEMRIGHTLTNPNFIGIVCSYAACVAVFLIFENLDQKRYSLVLFLLASALFCGYFAFLSGSRMTYLTLFVGAMILFLIEIVPKLTLKRAVVFISMISIVLFLFFHLEAFSLSRHRMMQAFLLLNGEGTSEGSMNHRKLLLEEGLRLFSEHPFFGNGVDALREIAGYNAHNNYVEILSNNGIIGFALYYFTYLVNCLMLLKVKKKDSLYSIMLFTMISLIVNEVAQTTYYDRFSQVKLALVSCYLVLEFQKRRNKEYV
ncbi:O-antigen ligase family protein [Candidatus Enterococcus murrayae]|uniref:O-antigen ligase family protein n=1 Tax=Candidatus Enterococcus murrayae TaxID=2815321 RepID=A0ABS3HMA0_9ENTE|nr:O-antigen ligase family protein [Enterococcus sp. MJM16]MBO0454020.1 O-antigen ligase family protein [Enterococcus sp. MJM16]